MPKSFTREQLIKKGKLLRKSLSFFSFFKLKSKRTGKEMFIDTGNGKVRILGYGFENSGIDPIFFDLHGGGFMLGNAEMDEAMNIGFMKNIGCKVISIDYAKAPKKPYPVAVNQIYNVVNYFYKHA